MRTIHSRDISTVLFGKTRRAVLGLFYTRPDEWIHLRLAARLCNSAVGATQRELAELSSVGILEKEARGNQLVFRANQRCAVFHELKSLVIKTTGLGDFLRAALAASDMHPRVAFIYGSFARAQPRQESDVDVMLIGDVSLAEAVAAFAQTQRNIGREINPTVYSVAEFAEKAHLGHHFITRVLQGDKIFLTGDERELDRVAKERLAKIVSSHGRRN